MPSGLPTHGFLKLSEISVNKLKPASNSSLFVAGWVHVAWYRLSMWHHVLGTSSEFVPVLRVEKLSAALLCCQLYEKVSLCLAAACQVNRTSSARKSSRAVTGRLKSGANFQTAAGAPNVRALRFA